MLFEYEKWKIEIDEERTRAYYNTLPAQNTQANRNLMLYLECMQPQDRAIADALCFDPSKLNTEGALYVSTYLHRERGWTGWADCYVFGKILQEPQIDMITLDDVAEQGIEILADRETGEITAGALRFEIEPPDCEEAEKPAGALYISVCVDAVAWLLDEPCENTETEGFTVFEKVKWNLHSLFVGKREEREEMKKDAARIAEWFAAHGMILTPMEHRTMLQYKKEWVSHYTDDPKIAKAALPSRRMHNLLWHVFSFEEGKALEGEAASAAFDTVPKGGAVMYVDDADTAFCAQSISDLTAKGIESLCSELEMEYMDIVITAADFSWTYCRTHEVGWMGPYFYAK